jgi:hypothetical protein
LIITLVFEKNAIFSQKIGENRRKLWSLHRALGVNVFFVVVVVAARNFRILHTTNKDATSGQIWPFATMPGVKHCNINYRPGGHSCAQDFR